MLPYICRAWRQLDVSPCLAMPATQGHGWTGVWVTGRRAGVLDVMFVSSALLNGCHKLQLHVDVHGQARGTGMGQLRSSLP